nr:uncharacterized protein LOC105319252 isoform X1 [Crassostrea gigas]
MNNFCRVMKLNPVSMGCVWCKESDQTAQDRIEVEGSGEVLTHTGKVPVVDDELMTTRVPGTNNKQTTRDSVKFTNEEVLTKDNKVSGSDNSKKTASTDIVFIIAPAVVGTVALLAVVIAIVLH